MIKEQEIVGYGDNILKKTLDESSDTVIKAEKMVKLLIPKITTMSLNDVTMETSTELKNIEKLRKNLQDRSTKYFNVIEIENFNNTSEIVKKIEENTEKLDIYCDVLYDMISLLEVLIQVSKGDINKIFKNK